MADFSLSPNMQLSVPTVAVAPGPDWAQLLNNCMTRIDGHDHTPGFGVKITPAGLDINNDLSMASNNLTLARSVQFDAATVADIASIYVQGVDLYFNDGSGNVIRVTQTGGLAGTPGSISNLVAPATASYAALNSSYVFQSGVNIAASLDGRDVLLRNSSASSFALTLTPPLAMAADYQLTLPSLPASLSILTVDTSGAMGYTMTSVSADPVGVAMSATGANAVADTRTRAVASTVGAGGVAVSSSSGNYSTGSTSFVTVTNLSVTITTTGRPVFVGLISDGNGVSNQSVVGCNPARSLLMQVVRDSTQLSFVGINSFLPPSSVSHVDAVAVGSHTYSIQVRSLTGDDVDVKYTKLVAYEL